MSERIRKVNELIGREVAGALGKIDIEGLITVKTVETSRDMKHACVWIGILGGEEEDALSVLERERHEIQQTVNKVIIAKYVPVLSFKIDHSGEYAEKIEKLLRNGQSKKS